MRTLRSFAWAACLSSQGVPVVGAAQAMVDDRPSPCVAAPPDSRDACSGRLLDAPAAPPPLSILPVAVSLPNARVGRRYDRALVRGGRGPYAARVDGSLPDGLRIDAEGHLIGVPAQAGTFAFVLEIRDSARPPATARAPFRLVVREAAAATAPGGAR